MDRFAGTKLNQCRQASAISPTKMRTATIEERGSAISSTMARTATITERGSSISPTNARTALVAEQGSTTRAERPQLLNKS
jgi:hypothetical protein